MVGPQELRHGLVTRTGGTLHGSALDEWPQPPSDGRRQDAFEVFERGALQVLVVGMKAPKRNLQRLAREHERQQGEDVREALARPRPYELVERRVAVARVGHVEQATAFPHASPHGAFAVYAGEDMVAVDLNARIGV